LYDLQCRSIAYLETSRIEQLANQGPAPSDFAVGDPVLICHPQEGLKRVPQSYLQSGWVLVSSLLWKRISTLCATYVLVRLKAFDASRCPDLRAEAAKEMGEYVVRRIVEHKGSLSTRLRAHAKFLVEWDGYDEEENSWLDWEQVKKLEALDVYCKLHNLKI
jgi:hypothetical protein